MWWPTHARAALARQKVLFSSAPQASSGARRRAPAARCVGHVAARAAQHQRPRRRGRAHDRVVGARLDRAVVEQEQVGDAGAGARARRRRGRRSARRRRCRWSSRAARPRRRAAGGGAASRAASRRARGSPGRPPARPRASGRRGASTIGRSRPASSALARPASSSTSARAASRSATISANGLSSRCLRARSAATARLVVGAAGEVEAADALDGDDRAVAQRRRGGRDGIAARPSAAGAARRPAAPRPAGRARVRLGVEAAVARILVLGPAAPRTSRSRPSSSAAGRRGRRARS